MMLLANTFSLIPLTTNDYSYGPVKMVETRLMEQEYLLFCGLILLNTFSLVPQDLLKNVIRHTLVVRSGQI